MSADPATVTALEAMKFLRDRTKLRVPRLIGYGFGDDDESPVPFIIMENVGLPLSVFYSRFREKFPHALDRVLDSLAQQYLELFSHPFDKIGSLHLTPDR